MTPRPAERSTLPASRELLAIWTFNQVPDSLKACEIAATADQIADGKPLAVEHMTAAYTQVLGTELVRVT